MAINIQNSQQILINMLANVTEKLDKREGSLIHSSLAPIAKMLAKLYLDLIDVENNSFVQTANGNYLDMIAEERGLTRLVATASVRKGKFDKEIPLGSTFETISGSNSMIFVVTEFIESSGGMWYYRLECSEKGVMGNGYTGGLTDLNNIDGLGVAQLEDIIIPGTENETDDELRERYLRSLDSKSFGGNLASYEDYLQKVDGLGPFQIYPFWQGGGTVLISFLNSDQQIPDAEFVKQVQAMICPAEADDGEPSANGYGVAPIGAKVTVKAPDKVELTVSGKVMIQVGEDFETVKQAIKTNVERYLTGLRKNWGNREKATDITYKLSVLYAQIYAQIVNTENVLNLKEIKLNGGEADLELTQSRERQEVPYLTNFDITEWLS